MSKDKEDTNNTDFTFAWNGHSHQMLVSLQHQLKTENFIDILVVAEHETFKAHKLPMIACSTYISEMLRQDHGKLPIIILNGISQVHLKMIIDYIYKGYFTIKQTDINDFLETASSMKLKGLTVNDVDLSQTSKPPLGMNVTNSTNTNCNKLDSSEPKQLTPGSKKQSWIAEFIKFTSRTSRERRVTPIQGIRTGEIGPNGKESILCEFCNIRLLDPNSIYRHRKIHYDQRQFYCSYCPKKFIQRGNLKKHIEVTHRDWKRKDNDYSIALPDIETNLIKERQKTEYEDPENVVEEFGNMDVKIEPIEKENNKLVAWSKANFTWHIKAGRDSYFPITIKAPNPSNEDGLKFIRLRLIRRNSMYRHIPVDTICNKHADTNDPEDKGKVIQLVSGNCDTHWYSDGPRRSLCITYNKSNTEEIDLKIGIKIICSDTCQNSSKHKINREGARDLLLTLTLESKESEKEINIKARRSISIWPKAKISDRELLKEVRRTQKGRKTGQQKVKKIKLQEEITDYKISSDQSGASGSDSPK